jgi:hypothetical protein
MKLKKRNENTVDGSLELKEKRRLKKLSEMSS